MRRLFVGLIVISLVLVTLNLVTVEVPAVNDHEGAVAFTQPQVTAQFSESGTGDRSQIPSMISKVAPTIVADPKPYITEQPTRRSLFQVIFPASLGLPPASGDEGTTIGGGSGCTVLSTETAKFSVQTYAILTVLGPGGVEYPAYTSDPVDTLVTQTVNHLSCTSITTPNTAWIFSGSASYDIGTFYFTNGWGTYAFKAEIWRVVDGEAADVKLGSTQLAVTPSGGT